MALKQRIIQIVKKNKKLFILSTAVRLLQTATLFEINGSKKKYPKIIQLPITYNCNSRCVMCNVWQMDHAGEANIEEFAKFMKDAVFKEVEAVGINGGEPSLVPNLPEYAEAILSLPKIKALNLISHGFSQKPLLVSLEAIYKTCREKNVHFHVAISLDGVEKVHDVVRGKANVFEKTVSTIDTIVKDQKRYCDSYDLGCTIVKQNIDYLAALDIYAKNKNYNLKYRLGVSNKRIQSDAMEEYYSVLHDRSSRQSAKEFFFGQMQQTKDLIKRFKYYAIFTWLDSKKPKRILGCMWKDEGITLDARGELYYCAVVSKSIGSLRRESSERIFFDDKNITYRQGIIKHSCDSCIHDYGGHPRLRDVWMFFTDMLKARIAMKFYRLKAGLL